MLYNITNKAYLEDSMERKVTIQDIANMANVSKSSVSRYLNNGYVSEENSKRINGSGKALLSFQNDPRDSYRSNPSANGSTPRATHRREWHPGRFEFCSHINCSSDVATWHPRIGPQDWPPKRPQ